MIVHVVLLRPRPDLSPDARRDLAAAFQDALHQIPSIKRARVGRRIRTGRPYDALMRADYPYAAMLEFDDRNALSAYLEHPVHAQLSSRFYAAFEDALMYDFELSEGTAGLAAILSDTH